MRSVLSNIQEIKARNGRVIAIVSKGDETISKIADEVIELPETLECLRSHYWLPFLCSY